MYGGFDVFRVYMAVKLHFTTDYNYFDYDGKVNIKLDTFTKRNDRYFFHKLSTKYKQDEILDFFVANFIDKDKNWVGNLLENDGREIYLNYKKVKDNFNYNFRNDFVNILNDFSSKRLSFDDGFVCIMDNIHDFYVYLFKGERLSKPSLCLTKSYRLSKIGINKLKRILSGLKSHISCQVETFYTI